MSDWVRLWDDMPTDPKWRVVVKRASHAVTDSHGDIKVSHVIAIFTHMLINAGGWKHWGTLENWNDEVVAAAIDIESGYVLAIREAMQGLVLDGDRILNWEKRQTKQADSSAERTAEWRKRKRDGGDGDVTVSDGDVTKGDVSVTQSDAEEKRRESSFLEKKKQKTRARDSDFEKFWGRNPNKVGKAAAQKSFDRARCRATQDEIIEGLDRYVRDKPPDRQWCNPATWLNQDRWTDQPAIAGKMNGHAGAAKVPGPLLVFVTEDTPQWMAWDAFYRTTKGTSPPKTNRGHTFERGWHFPTEWPPEETTQ